MLGQQLSKFSLLDDDRKHYLIRWTARRLVNWFFRIHQVTFKLNTDISSAVLCSDFLSFCLDPWNFLDLWLKTLGLSSTKRMRSWDGKPNSKNHWAQRLNRFLQWKTARIAAEIHGGKKVLQGWPGRGPKCTKEGPNQQHPEDLVGILVDQSFYDIFHNQMSSSNNLTVQILKKTSSKNQTSSSNNFFVS